MKTKIERISFPCRMSVRMLRGIEQIVACRAGEAAKQQVIQSMVNQYIQDPICLLPVENIELREPLGATLTISLTKTSWEWISDFATSRGISLSAQMRNIILCGLRQEGVL